MLGPGWPDAFEGDVMPVPGDTVAVARVVGAASLPGRSVGEEPMR